MEASNIEVEIEAFLRNRFTNADFYVATECCLFIKTMPFKYVYSWKVK